MTTDNLENRVFESCPGWRQARDRLDQLATIEQPSARAPSAVEQTADDINASIDAGGMPDVLALARTADAEVGAVAVARAALDLGKLRARQEMDESIRDGADEILSALNNELGDMVEEVRSLTPLAGIVTETAAVHTDRTQEFKRLRSVLARYPEVRRLQLKTVRDSSGGDYGTDHVLAMFLAEPEAVWPMWAAWHTHGQVIERATSRLVVAVPPWPHADDNDPRIDGKRTLSKDALRPEFALWAIENDFTMWVPTRQQLRKASHRLHDSLADRVDDGHSRYVDPGTVDVGGRRVKAGDLR